jgi:hypothetical protein
MRVSSSGSGPATGTAGGIGSLIRARSQRNSPGPGTPTTTASTDSNLKQAKLSVVTSKNQLAFNVNDQSMLNIACKHSLQLITVTVSSAPIIADLVRFCGPGASRMRFLP